MLSFMRSREKSETHHGKKHLCRTQFSVRRRTHDAVLHETREEESFSLQVFLVQRISLRTSEENKNNSTPREA